MTPEQIDLVRSSYAALGDTAPDMAVGFYRRLFASDPAVEGLFSDPSVMPDKFAAELGMVVEAIADFDAFAARIDDLARRHLAYGIRTRHYRLAGDALVGALAERLGEDWSAELEDAWRRAYNLVAESMMAVTGPHPGGGPSR